MDTESGEHRCMRCVSRQQEIATARAEGAAQEREACAQIADASAATFRLFRDDAPNATSAKTMDWVARHAEIIATAIRERKDGAT